MGLRGVIACGLWLCYFVSQVSGQAEPDSLEIYDLEALAVTVSSTRNAQAVVNAPVARVDYERLTALDASSPLAGINGTPGVRFEERAPGSYRLSIRGSALRAPFGVRNVKVYWNGFPLTEPGGDTPLNALDVLNMPVVRIYKGPAGSRYGSGTGGGLLINGDQSGPPRGLNLNLEGGSFGYGRASLQYRRRDENGRQLALRLAGQRTDGYRDHSQFARGTAELYLHRPAPDRNSGLKLHALFSEVDYEIPGGLNPEQFAENPRQARPRSSTTKSGVRRQLFLAGLTHYGGRPAGWRQVSRVYLTGNRFENPFVVDYKRELNLGAGFRSVASRDYQWGRSQRLRLDVGAEGQWQYRNAANYEAETGDPGALNFTDDIASRQYLIFGSARYGFGNDWSLEGSLSGQQLNYRIDRATPGGGAVERTEAGYDFVLAPRVALAKALRQNGVDYTIFLAYARAFSPPTLREFRTNEGSLNVDLSPERGDALELGVGVNTNRNLRLDVNAYYQILQQSITTFQDSSGVQLFRNAGGNRTFGLEIALHQQLLRPAADGSRRILRRAESQVAFAYQRGRYRNYVTGGSDFSGQDLPGLSPLTLDVQLRSEWRGGFFLNLGGYTAGRTPLNDANEVFAESFVLLRARLGKHFRVGRGQGELYVGGNNLLDQTFSLGYDLNPQFGERYFQPAAGANFYVGVRWSR